jgi:hypothetical protein
MEARRVFLRVVNQVELPPFAAESPVVACFFTERTSFAERTTWPHSRTASWRLHLSLHFLELPLQHLHLPLQGCDLSLYSHVVGGADKLFVLAGRLADFAELHQFDVERLRFAIPTDLHFHFVPFLLALHAAQQIAGGAHPLAVEAPNHITALQAGFIRGTPLDHMGDYYGILTIAEDQSHGGAIPFAAIFFAVGSRGVSDREYGQSK